MGAALGIRDSSDGPGFVVPRFRTQSDENSGSLPAGDSDATNPLPFPTMPSTPPQDDPIVIQADARALLRARRRRLDEALAALDDRLDEAAGVVEAIGRVLEDGGTIYTCGNGGSAAEALHLAEELVGRYRTDRRPLPSVCLNADPTALTCIANDFGFDAIFRRQCEALVGPSDALVAFSTSGPKPQPRRRARDRSRPGATCIGFLGGDGGSCEPLCDVSFIAPAATAPRSRRSTSS